MNHERYLDLCAMYALGALDGDDLREFEAHLEEGCAECERELAAMRETVVDLAAAAPPAAPPPELKDRVLKATVRPSRRLVLALAAAAGLAAAALVMWAAIPDEPEWQTFALAPTDAAPGPLRASVTYDPEAGRAVVTFENYAAPAGKTYELWAVRPGQPVPESLGLVSTDAAGRGKLEIADAGAFDALAVSLEPTGGAPAGGGPTGPVVSAGSPGA